MPVNLYFASILLTCALSGVLALYAWRQPPLPGVRAYAGLAFSACLLALAEILSMLSGTQAQALVWFNLRFIFTAIIPVIWVAFALAYSGQQGWLSKKLLAGALAMPAITQVVLGSNDLHGLWVKQEVGFHQNGPFWIAEASAHIPGLWFMLHSSYGPSLLLAGIGVSLFAAWRKQRRDRGQALLLSAGALVALTTTPIPAFNLLPEAEFNLFIPGIGISVLLCALAIFRSQFLKRLPGQEGASRMPSLEPQERRSLAVPVFVFILVASSLAAVSYLAYKNYEEHFRSQVESQLSAVALLKIRELQDWRNERLADARLFYHNEDVSELVRRTLEIPGDADAQNGLARWLERIQANPEYERVFLLDAQARERMSSPAVPRPPAALLIDQVASTLASGQISMLDFHRDTADGPIYLALLVPIFDPHDGRPLGVLVLRIDPNVYLYPFIQQWPVPSQSAETLIVRRDDDDVLFLNDLKYDQNTALNLRIPLENTEILSVKAVLGQSGIAQGLDYRGVAVIGYIAAVPDSPWFLVARADIAEVYAPLRERLWQTVSLFGALMLAAGSGLALVWRQQRVRYYRGQVHAAEALRESEERYKLANRATFNAIWDRNLRTDALWWNENFQTLFGYQAEEIEPGIESWTSRIHPEDVERVGTGIHAAIDSGEQTWFDHYRFRRKDGQYAEIEDRGYISREASGKPVRMIGAMQDVSQRKRQEAEILAAQAGLQRLFAEADQARRALLSVVEDLRTAEEGIRSLNAELEQRVLDRTAQLQTVNQELEAFAYSVSHDLRAPLRAIGGFSRIVLDEHAAALPPEAQRYLHLVQDNTQQMGRLVDDLLAFSRLSRQPLAKQPVDPAGLVSAALQDLHAEQAGRQIDLVIRDLPSCQADPGLLKQVWVNLLSNALKFTRRREAAVIEVGAYEEDTHPVYYVKDNGVGFDMRYVGKLFGVFQRLHKAEEYEGTGVGLAIVQRIVHRHGGRVWAEAKVGQGATFWFTLEGGTGNDEGHRGDPAGRGQSE